MKRYWKNGQIFLETRNQRFNLTMMFGKGNEPSKAEFLAMSPPPFYNVEVEKSVWDQLKQINRHRKKSVTQK